ncbi:cytoplasmic FMR1-interacting [Neocallimastix lanati (nom. inval.)]|nr:cytoplasmic FMR1-interacting [Neocallimastix sp. JGI-2020a]
MDNDFKQYLKQLEVVVPFSIEPTIQSSPEIFSYSKIETKELEDSYQYEWPDYPSQMKSEIKCIKLLSEQIDQGNEILNMLYTYRSCSRAIHQVFNPSKKEQSNNSQVVQENKEQINLKTFQVLQPEIEKVKKLKQFHDDTTKVLGEIMNYLMIDVDINVVSVSSRFCMKLAEYLDMIVTIDSLKIMKSSLNNDMTMYRRSFSNLPNDYLAKIDKAAIDEINQSLYLFLAERDQFITDIKNIFQKNSRLEEIFTEIMNFYVDAFENNQWFMPKERNILLKAMAIGIFILDGTDDSKSILKNKKIKIDRFYKIFKTYPIVSAFGYFPISLITIYSKAPHFDAKKFGEINNEAVAKTYNICNYIDQIRNEYNNFICEFGLTMEKFKTSLTKKASLLCEENKRIYNITLQGLQLLARIKCQLEDQISWKFANPKNRESLDISNDIAVTDYELGLKYNLSNNDKNALIEYIGMIKNLGSLLKKYVSFQPSAINNYVYVEVQQFAKLSIQKCIEIANKKKKSVSNTYSQILTLIEDTNIISKEKQKNESDIPKRDVGLTKTQLFLIKYLLDSSFVEKNKSKNNFKKKDFPDVQQYMEKHFFFEYMLDLEDTINECTDLSGLWYKEFYLELSKQIQFPVEMSLPWILCSHIISSGAYNLTEYILYPLDIYNDAAQYALYKLRSKYLYDEIEAEVNLCFQHFMFYLCQKIFTHFKIHGTTLIMGNGLLKKANKTASHLLKDYLQLDHYDSILRQKSFMLLGRNIDISKIISENMANYMKNSLDYIIAKFEQSDLTGIIDLDIMLQSSKAAYELMSKHLTLEPFESLLMQIDETLSVVNFNGRIVSHVIAELYNDFLVNWCYNSTTERFIRSQNFLECQRSSRKVNTSGLYGNKALYNTISSITNIYKNYFGIQHFNSLLKVLKRESIATVLCELENYEITLLEKSITPIISVIQKAFPANIKLPLYQYGAEGAYGYFYHSFADLINYPDLRDGVYQSFREFGNVFIFVFQLDKAMTSEASKAKILTMNIWDKEKKTFNLSSKLSIADEVLNSKNFSMNYKNLSDRYEFFFKAITSTSTCLLADFIERIQSTVEQLQTEWEKKENLFFKVWSAIQFTFCITNSAGYNNRELYGDSLQWSGCLLILLCNQVKSFIAFDYLMHIINVHNYNMNKIKYEHKKDKEASVNISQEFSDFLDKANWYIASNDEVFEIFSNHLYK